MCHHTGIKLFLNDNVYGLDQYHIINKNSPYSQDKSHNVDLTQIVTTKIKCLKCFRTGTSNASIVQRTEGVKVREPGDSFTERIDPQRQERI
jgi:hypothetical protein